MTSEERLRRAAAISGVREKLGAVAEHAYEPPSSAIFVTTQESRSRGMKGGVTMQVGKRQAAVLIVDGSHREASPEEIEAYHQAEEDRKQAARDLVNKSEGRCVIFTSPRPADGTEMSNSRTVDEQ